MDRDHLMQIVQPMLAGFKLEIAKMRSEGATQAEIDLMLDEFEEVYAPDDDAEGKLVVEVLRQAARLATCSLGLRKGPLNVRAQGLHRRAPCDGQAVRGGGATVACNNSSERLACGSRRSLRGTARGRSRPDAGRE